MNTSVREAWIEFASSVTFELDISTTEDDSHLIKRAASLSSGYADLMIKNLIKRETVDVEESRRRI